MFNVLTGFAFFIGLLAGLVVTADSIAQEKRDGTLGLLFLTDLNSRDIVLGKLAATSLNVLYGLVAIIPLLMISLLFGSITAQEVIRAAISLLNLVMLGLSAGLVGSSLMQKSGDAFGVGIGVVFIIFAMLPLLGAWGESRWNWSHANYFYWTSPAYAFSRIDSLGDTKAFWCSTGFGICWCSFLFFLATRFCGRAWKEKPAATWRLRLTELHNRLAFGGPVFRRKLRNRLLDKNPMMWLTSRNRISYWSTYAPMLIGIVIIGWGWILEYRHSQHRWVREPELVLTVGFIMNLVCKIRAAAEGANCFAEDRRSGALELVLASCLTEREIVRGSWRGICRQLVPGILAVLLVEWIGFLICKQSAHDSEVLWIAILGTAVFILDCFAMAWTAMWIGLKTKNSNTAILSACWRMLMLPWLLAWFLAVVFGNQAVSGISGFLVLYGLASAIPAFASLVNSRNNLYRYFRVLAANSGMQKLSEAAHEKRLFARKPTLPVLVE